MNTIEIRRYTCEMLESLDTKAIRAWLKKREDYERQVRIHNQAVPLNQLRLEQVTEQISSSVLTVYTKASGVQPANVVDATLLLWLRGLLNAEVTGADGANLSLMLKDVMKMPPKLTPSSLVRDMMVKFEMMMSTSGLTTEFDQAVGKKAREELRKVILENIRDVSFRIRVKSLFEGTTVLSNNVRSDVTTMWQQLLVVAKVEMDEKHLQKLIADEKKADQGKEKAKESPPRSQLVKNAKDSQQKKNRSGKPS